VTSLPPIDLKPQKRSLTNFEKRTKSNDKNNQTEMKSKRFETLPSDIECMNRFPMEERPKVATSREGNASKKQFIEIDMLSLLTWYAKNDLTQSAPKPKEKFEAKEEVKEITAIPTKLGMAGFIQNYKSKN
jgi:hypothetical protein